jgi:hypothetical protein
VGKTTYFLSKGETFSFLVIQYSDHMTVIHHRIGQHDCGANVVNVVEDMVVLEVSEQYDSIFWSADYASILQKPYYLLMRVILLKRFLKWVI